MRFLRKLANGERHAAEDLFQEVMLRAWQHVDDLQDDPSTLSWLFTVARRLTIDAVRRRNARPPEVELAKARTRPADDDTMASALAAVSIPLAWRALTSGQRQLLLDVHVGGESSEVLAKRLGTPIGTVKSRAHYALRALRDGAYSTGDEEPAARPSHSRRVRDREPKAAA
ncbi:sigma-70 family RNA polymerase sigma factor [Actinoplanes sp. TBRC 11911]|uniref:sigma-70 family RNA polymerase sigma factor n=1 Tax=Actinoplanes sp. TBRC 11911 TaxID=2729386 RepID=UPI00200716C1|nr:sigma-70 family RNA polymerase sigma factor [Actinoplanes sp. TBRC 11911]